nr:MAG TPA: hypothetical protein [Caudoviricetes sp.]
MPQTSILYHIRTPDSTQQVFFLYPFFDKHRIRM